MAMPVKKKRKLDPQILRAREERRKKRITKALKKMEKKPRIARPIMELEPSVELIAEAETHRKRSNVVVSNDIINSRELLMKEWNRFSGLRHISEIRQLDSVIISQQEALDLLREESEELYQEAIQPDMSLIPFQCIGPTQTLPIPNHFVDGTYEVSVLYNLFSLSTIV
jgi:large subunit ribosomal protein L40